MTRRRARREAEAAQDQAARDTGTTGRTERITPGGTKRAIAVSRILVPVLAPVAMRAAGTVRGLWDERRARRLGVAPGELGDYTGRGAALSARIAGIARSLTELENSATRSDRSPAAGTFVAEQRPRLTDLSAAVHAAEHMPAERRRSAHRAVAAELDRIEPELLRELGLHPGAQGAR